MSRFLIAPLVTFWSLRGQKKVMDEERKSILKAPLPFGHLSQTHIIRMRVYVQIFYTASIIIVFIKLTIPSLPILLLYIKDFTYLKP